MHCFCPFLASVRVRGSLPWARSCVDVKQNRGLLNYIEIHVVIVDDGGHPPLALHGGWVGERDGCDYVIACE